MCGIVGYTGAKRAVPVLLAGLKRLEYRGYDSAGIAVYGAHGIAVAKAAGQIENLIARTQNGAALTGGCGIGHTRWATHGAPDETNAHPHASPGNRVVMVHNGIIENHEKIRAELAAAGCVQRVVHMNDGEIACIKAGGALFFDASGRSVRKHAEQLELEEKEIEKAGYAHFMLKEIHEQPQVVRRTIAPYIKETRDGLRVELGAAGIGKDLLARADRVHFIGCGSAYHAGCVGRMVTERLARIPCEAELASEIRYGEPVFTPDALAVIISQSGETADSLAALRLCKAHGVRTLAIVNVIESAMAREADAVLCTQAGPEISVATTKAYAAQLAALYLLAIALASSRGAIAKAREKQLAKALLALPERIAEALSCSGEVKALAGRIAGKRDVFFIGRGLDHAVCMEGSLKLKEISYIHSEAYAAGELKHGTISLIEEGVSVIGVMTQKALLSKTMANLEEVKSRGAQTVVVASRRFSQTRQGDAIVPVPDTDELFAASLLVVPLQLLSYHVSCDLGLDVDKPRNLAKAVTVE